LCGTTGDTGANQQLTVGDLEAARPMVVASHMVSTVR